MLHEAVHGDYAGSNHCCINAAVKSMIHDAPEAHWTRSPPTTNLQWTRPLRPLGQALLSPLAAPVSLPRASASRSPDALSL